MKITGAQAILKSLLHEGVDLVFGYPGGAIMPLYDALYDLQSENCDTFLFAMSKVLYMRQRVMRDYQER